MKYLLSNTDIKAAEKTLWFSHCKSERIPCITIEVHGEHSTVEWDYISLPIEFDSRIKRNRERLLHGFQSIYDKYSNGKSEARFNCHVPRFINIESSKAELLASELYDFVYAVLELNRLHA